MVWRPNGWEGWKRRTLVNLAPAKATITDDVLIEQTADAMLEGLKKEGVKFRDGCPEGMSFDEFDAVMGKWKNGTVVFIPDQEIKEV